MNPATGAAETRPPATLEDLVSDAHIAVAETNWADPADAFSTQSYLAAVQRSLPASHQLSMCQITGLGWAVLAVATLDGAWTICVPGVGVTASTDLGEAGVAAGKLLEQTGNPILNDYLDNSPPPARLVDVDVVSGPHTIVALGEDCLVCQEELEPGAVYVFCRDATGSGVAHEYCVDIAGQALLL